MSLSNQTEIQPKEKDNLKEKDNVNANEKEKRESECVSSDEIIKIDHQDQVSQAAANTETTPVAEPVGFDGEYNIEKVLDPEGSDNYTLMTLLKNNGLAPTDLDKIYKLWVNKHITLGSVFGHREAIASISNFIINYGDNNRKPSHHTEVKSTIISTNKVKGFGTYSEQKNMAET